MKIVELINELLAGKTITNRVSDRTNISNH